MSRFDPLRTLFESMGWEATPIELASDCWWAKEIWKLRSLWTPVDKEIFLSLLVDPSVMHDNEEPNEAMVWAVGLSETFPTDRIEAE